MLFIRDRVADLYSRSNAEKLLQLPKSKERGSAERARYVELFNYQAIRSSWSNVGPHYSQEDWQR